MDKFFCPNCAAELELGVRYCPRCGWRQRATTATKVLLGILALFAGVPAVLGGSCMLIQYAIFGSNPKRSISQAQSDFLFTIGALVIGAILIWLFIRAMKPYDDDI